MRQNQINNRLATCSCGLVLDSYNEQKQRPLYLQEVGLELADVFGRHYGLHDLVMSGYIEFEEYSKVEGITETQACRQNQSQRYLQSTTPESSLSSSLSSSPPSSSSSSSSPSSESVLASRSLVFELRTFVTDEIDSVTKLQAVCNLCGFCEVLHFKVGI